MDLHLGSNNICDVGALLLVNLLAANMTKLLVLNIDDNDLSANGWIAFNNALINVMCHDASSVDTIYSSNHSLTYLDDIDHPLDLNNLLTLNKNKAKVSQQKILLHFFTHEDRVGRFFSVMPPQLLPSTIISWIGKDHRGFAAMYFLL